MIVGRLNRKASLLTNMAYSQLREAIICGNLPSGQPLVEERLASDLDISRTPLREALAKLEHEGLIEAVPYRGTFVTGLSPSEYLQGVQIRERLETLAIELAIDNIPEEEIVRVQMFTRESEPLLAKGDVSVNLQCQFAFHDLAPHFSGNGVLERFIHKLEEDSARFLHATHDFRPEHMLASADEHLGILELYRRRDRETAIARMVTHLRDSALRGLRSMP